MPSHIEVQDLAPSVLDDEEAIEQLEGDRRHGEEVDGDDHLTMILQKRKPPFGWVTAAAYAPQIPSHTPFGDDEAGEAYFTVVTPTGKGIYRFTK